MYIDFSKLFHRASKDRSDQGEVNIPKDHSLWPESWKKIPYKEYERLLKIELPKNFTTTAVMEAIRARYSTSKFKEGAITLEELSAILKYSCGETGRLIEDRIPRRAQPSGGARFPVEMYALVLKSADGLESGVYHYNVRLHCLERLAQRKFTEGDFASLYSYEWASRGSVALIMTTVFSRTNEKYGQRGYRYALLEAGHVGQNVYLTARSLDINCRSIGGSNEEMIENLLHIDGTHESVIYSIILGH